MNTSNPKWWQLYLIFPLLILLFLLDHRLKISTRGHEVVQIGIILMAYGLVSWWMKANRSALSHIDRQQPLGGILIVQVPPKQLPESNAQKHPMLQILNSEVKGMLSTTFEMDTIDVEAFPIEEASQETNKE